MWSETLIDRGGPGAEADGISGADSFVVLISFFFPSLATSSGSLRFFSMHF